MHKPGLTVIEAVAYLSGMTKKRNRVLEVVRKQKLFVPIANACGVTRQAVHDWHEGDEWRVPAQYVRKVAEITGLPPEVIRPDIFA